MYLARKYINGKIRYFIRESYSHGDYLLSRELIDLGPDPGRFIIYPGGNSFYIDDIIETRINESGGQADPDILEDIFWRFLRPPIKRALEPFRNREKRHQSNRKKRDTRPDTGSGAHIFDKRRIHFLKLGRTDQGNLAHLPQKLFHIFQDKSRDEIEQMFLDMERELPVREYKTYVYVIFDLQRHFHESVARSHPQMLNQVKVDEHFVEDICRLNVDALFWAGMPFENRLSDYLARYAFMYFDYDYGPSAFMDEYIRQFINARRDYRPPPGTPNVSLKEASTIFGRSTEEMKKMNARELTRQYRLKAQKIHPDKGGDHDKFVKLTEAYHRLMKSKR